MHGHLQRSHECSSTPSATPSAARCCRHRGPVRGGPARRPSPGPVRHAARARSHHPRPHRGHRFAHQARRHRDLAADLLAQPRRHHRAGPDLGRRRDPEHHRQRFHAQQHLQQRRQRRNPRQPAQPRLQPHPGAGQRPSLGRWHRPGRRGRPQHHPDRRGRAHRSPEGRRLDDLRLRRHRRRGQRDPAPELRRRRSQRLPRPVRQGRRHPPVLRLHRSAPPRDRFAAMLGFGYVKEEPVMAGDREISKEPIVRHRHCASAAAPARTAASRLVPGACYNRRPAPASVAPDQLRTAAARHLHLRRRRHAARARTSPAPTSTTSRPRTTC